VTLDQLNQKMATIPEDSKANISFDQ